MSLFNRAIRPPTSLSGEGVERYLATLPAACEPDPLFHRRLRSDVVNRFVAAREGIDRPVRTGIGRRQMGRVGRACLYASFALGLSAAGVLAASQEALPGEALYSLKQRIEELRWEVVPAHLHGELAADALGERIEEMGRLADAGHLELAMAMAPTIDRDYERLIGLGQPDDAARAVRIERHLLVLEQLLEKLPTNARATVEDVIDRPPEVGQGTDRGPNAGNGGSGNRAAGDDAGAGPGAGTTAGPDPTPRPDRTPRPSTTRPERSPKPEPARPSPRSGASN